MRHACRLGYFEITEDDEGYLYIDWKRCFGSNTGLLSIEYCPFCGRKAKKSHLEDIHLKLRGDNRPKSLMDEYHIFSENQRFDAELWKKLRDIVYDSGYLCYHDDEGCHYVLREIMECFKDYSIKKKDGCVPQSG